MNGRENVKLYAIVQVDFMQIFTKGHIHSLLLTLYKQCPYHNDIADSCIYFTWSLQKQVAYISKQPLDQQL